MNGKFWGNIGLSVVILCLVAFAVMKVSASSGVQGLFLPEVKVSESTQELLQSVELALSAVNVQGVNHQVEAAFTVDNKGEHDIKNVSILCTLFDSQNREKGRDKWVVYDTVKAQENGSFTFFDKRFISASVVRSDCQIIGMAIAKPPAVAAHDASTGHGGGETVHDTGHGATH